MKKMVWLAGLTLLTLFAYLMSSLPPQPVKAAITQNNVVAGVWTVTSNGADAIDLSCSGGIARLNGVNVLGNPTCGSITKIVVNGGTGNVIDLGSVSCLMSIIGFCNVTSITINGGSGGDFITGSVFGEIINGLGGEDIIGGADGNDTITGGDGSDILVGGEGDDVLDGGAGSDSLEGGTGDDRYRFGPAAAFQVDFIRELSGGGTDTLDFSTLPASDPVAVTMDDGTNPIAKHINRDIDMFVASQDAFIENVNGSPGDDTIVGNGAPNVISGGLGNDIVNGGAGDDRLFGGDGNDIINGGDGDDELFGGAGNDSATVFGTSGGDAFTLTPSQVARTGESDSYGGVDTLTVDGLAGNDTFNVIAEPTTTINITCGAGTDTLTVDVQMQPFTQTANSITVQGRLPVNHTGCETANVANAQPTPPGPGVTVAVGWNNLPYLGASQAVEQALANCLSAVDAIFRWDAAAQGYGWWFKGAPAASTLAGLNSGVAVWAGANAACNWAQPAGPAPSASASLAVGWSNVPYLGATLMVEGALANCLSAVNTVFRWDAAVQGYMWWFKGAPAGVNTLASLSARTAVWASASAACDWMQPT